MASEFFLNGLRWGWEITDDNFIWLIDLQLGGGEMDLNQVFKHFDRSNGRGIGLVSDLRNADRSSLNLAQKALIQVKWHLEL